VTNRYTFVTQWRVDGMPAEVYELLRNSLDFVRWWPAVWLCADLVEPGDARGIGRIVRFVSKGWLPYLLRWTATTIESDPPRHLAIRASGDFEGEGRWSLAYDGAQTEVTYHWSIEANKPLLRYLSFALRPLFAANHHWAMARGEESLRLELARRRARTPEERQRIPAPPQPTFLSAARLSRLRAAAAE
jgi:hypothetical protein